MVIWFGVNIIMGIVVRTFIHIFVIAMLYCMSSHMAFFQTAFDKVSPHTTTNPPLIHTHHYSKLMEPYIMATLMKFASDHPDISIF